MLFKSHEAIIGSLTLLIAGLTETNECVSLTEPVVFIRAAMVPHAVVERLTCHYETSAGIVIGVLGLTDL